MEGHWRFIRVTLGILEGDGIVDQSGLWKGYGRVVEGLLSYPGVLKDLSVDIQDRPGSYVM